MADRFDVVETPQEPETNIVSCYSYIRGSFFDKTHKVHLNGLGDFPITNVTRLSDPCPLQYRRVADAKTGEKKKKRHLADKDKTLYAPFSNLGQLNFESNAEYINIPDKYVVYTKKEGQDEEDRDLHEGQQMVQQM